MFLINMSRKYAYSYANLKIPVNGGVYLSNQ